MSNTFLRCSLPSTGYIDFDFIQEIATISDDRDSVTVQEIVDCSRDVEEETIGLQFKRIIDAEGKISFGTGGLTTSITATLLEGWRIATAKTSGRFDIIEGNLVRWDGTDVYVPNTLVNQRQISAEFNFRDIGAAVNEVVKGNLITKFLK